MSPTRHPSAHRTAALAFALLGILAVTSTASAITWDPDVVVRRYSHGDLVPDDLAATGRNVAIAYSLYDYKGKPARLTIDESTDGGMTFGLRTSPVVHPIDYYNDVSLDVGGGRFWAVWTESDGEQLYAGGKPFGGDSWTSMKAGPSTPNIDQPAIAYSHGRLFVAYSSGTTDEGFLMHRRTSGGEFTSPIPLGPIAYSGTSGTPDVDASGATVLVVWADPANRILIKRGSIGGAPDQAVTWEPIRSIGFGERPQIAMDGDRVAIVTVSDDGIQYRGSLNGGETFAPAKWIFTSNGSVRGVDMALAANQVALTLELPGDPGRRYRLTSNGGDVWNTVPIRFAFCCHPRHVAFMGPGADPKLAEAWLEIANDREKIMFHREH